MKRTQVLGGGARQLVMASAIAAALDTDTAEEVTLTVSEPGVLDLDTLCIFAGATAVELYASQDFSLYTRIDSIKINNSLQLLRGRNIASAAGTAGAPGGAFSAYRQLNQIPLGQWDMDTADTVTIGLSVGGTGIAANTSFAAAFTPKDRGRGNSPVLIAKRPYSYVGSPVAEIAAAGSGTNTITFDADGWMSLSSLNIGGLSDETPGSAGLSSDPCGVSTITSITLPNGSNVLIGQNSPNAPAAMFGAGQRAFSFADLGVYPVSAGSTLAVALKNHSADVVNTNIGVRFLDKKDVASVDGCPC